MVDKLNYFAIGSMMNLTSMRLRGLRPELSRPATLIDFEVTFRGHSGMAFAEAKSGASFEGVLHTITAADMDALDKIEMGYVRSAATCCLYDDEVVACVVYTKNSDALKVFGDEVGEQLPTERYVDIIVRGMKEVGVRQEAIDQMSARPSQPRKKAAEFTTLEVPAGTPEWTMQQFRAESVAGRFLSVLNGKVSEYTGPREGPFWQRMQEKRGADTTFDMAQMIYEPLYGLPVCVEEMTCEHRAWAEDYVASSLKRIPPGFSEVVAVVSDYPPASDSVIHRVVFLRHGESVWDAANLFAGWHDVDLSAKGLAEVVDAGKRLKEEGFRFDIVFTSVLRRAIRTAWALCTHSENFAMPIINTWRLNDRHYGRLQGSSKSDAAAKHGEEQVRLCCRSFDVSPPQLERADPLHPCNDPLYECVPPRALPGAESLKAATQRVLPQWHDQIAPCVMAGKSVMVVGHEDSLRAICMYLKGMTETEVLDFSIAAAVPLVYELDRNLKFVKDYYLMDKRDVAVKDAAAAS